jgi:hypothetical protein
MGRPVKYTPKKIETTVLWARYMVSIAERESSDVDAEVGHTLVKGLKRFIWKKSVDDPLIPELKNRAVTSLQLRFPTYAERGGKLDVNAIPTDQASGSSSTKTSIGSKRTTEQEREPQAGQLGQDLSGMGKNRQRIARTRTS